MKEAELVTGTQALAWVFALCIRAAGLFHAYAALSPDDHAGWPLPRPPNTRGWPSSAATWPCSWPAV